MYKIHAFPNVILLLEKQLEKSESLIFFQDCLSMN